jgi:hypothetical protein
MPTFKQLGFGILGASLIILGCWALHNEQELDTVRKLPTYANGYKAGFQDACRAFTNDTGKGIKIERVEKEKSNEK